MSTNTTIVTHRQNRLKPGSIVWSMNERQCGQTSAISLTSPPQNGQGIVAGASVSS